LASENPIRLDVEVFVVAPSVTDHSVPAGSPVSVNVTLNFEGETVTVTGLFDAGPELNPSETVNDTATVP
jgi:hypothetical protein